jgi:Zinc finger, C3HC4 type (RING finger)
MNICIRNPITREWTSSVGRGGGVSPAIRDAYAGYKNRPNYYREKPHFTGEYIVYRPENDPYLPTYIARMTDIPDYARDVLNEMTGSVIITQEIHDTMTSPPMPIMDMDDVSVFIVDNPAMARANWLPAREYQAWAYRDFVYDEHRSIKKSYISRGTSPVAYESNDRILSNQIVTIPLPCISSNIVFNISRNDNNSVYFERNDAAGSWFRICDNEYARAGYLGFYTRITMDPGVTVIPPSPSYLSHSVTAVYYNAGSVTAPPALLSTTHIPAPEETDNEQHQCIICFKYRVNARFSPCEHHVCCSACYSKMTKNECPVCRAVITRVMNV